MIEATKKISRIKFLQAQEGDEAGLVYVLQNKSFNSQIFYHSLLWKTPNCLEIYPDEELCISTLIFSHIFHILPFGEVKNKSELSMLL